MNASPGRWPQAAGWLLLLAAPLASFLLLFPWSVNMPTWDQWSLIDLWETHAAGGDVAPILLAPYNGHYNVLAKAVFYGLGLATSWNVRADIVANYVAALATTILLATMVPRPQRPWLLPVIGVQVFCFLQFENFLSGYPLCQMLGQFLVVAMVGVLTRGEASMRRLLAAAGLAIAASLCWGAGVAAFVVGALILVARRAGPLRIALWCGLAAPVLWLARSASSGAVLTDWKGVPAFFFVLLGRPWVLSPEWSTRSSLVLGCLACGVFVAVAWRLRHRPQFAPWISLGLFSMGSSGLVALARSGAGPAQALASHYITASYPLLLACLVGAVLLLAEARFAGRQWVLGAIVILSIGQALWVSNRVHTQFAGWSGLMRRIASEIAWGTVSDADILRAHHPQVELVRHGAEVLRQHRLSWFADWPKNAPAGNFGNVDEPADLGATRWRVDRPLRMAGWAVDADWGAPVQAVELWLDDRLTGSAQVGLVRTDVAGYFDHPKALRSGWVLDLPPIAPGAEAAATPGVHRVRLTVVDPSGARRNLWQGDLQLERAGAEVTP